MGIQETREGSPLRTLWLAVPLIALALAQALLAWSIWNGRGSALPLSPGPTGGVYGVTLTSGAVFYGRLLESRSGYVKLGDVYYVESYIADPNGRRDNRLVSRQKNDWHGPETMLIPNDKILTIESVGAQSRLAKLIELDKAAPPPK